MRYPTHRSFFTPAFLVILLILTAFSVLLLPACVSKPITAAQTPEQKAYAVYGEFVIFEELGAQLVASHSLPATLRISIQEAAQTAHGTAGTLLTALQQYQAATQVLAAGLTTADKVAVATNNLNTWIAQAMSDLAALETVVKTASNSVNSRGTS